ncbi:peptidylprolyl isomerase [Hyalangium rubrum]|uniref:Peptidyl-prolyl cis-trans isomerase n=1 Tax=Hyalangium rubrum TaxID=3103134 RepID=A0ABU5HCH2_9BACT|nr:peptidylprolyl isomerase [Hyalangium sp. s54d21]MDY7231152.1 peptidylprolyl isomerase [Hyalangium sp. s54d21]
MSRLLATTLLLAATLASGAAPAGKWMKKAQKGKDLYATFKTSQGDIVVRLFPKEAPKTVATFVGLAAGEKLWKHSVTGEKSKQPLYPGTVFHRVIPEFMIQGGDPTGTGRGHPGFRFDDEFQSGRTFDKPGLLAMANAGPNTNGSQFFITTSTPTYLNGKHTIFGEVVQGYEVAVAISQVPRDDKDRPLTPVTLTKIELSDKPPKDLKQ